MTRSSATILLLALLAPACAEPPTDPCDRGGACTIARPDLAVVTAELAAAVHDDVSGLPVLPPDALPLEVVVRNGGGIAAPATILTVEMEGRGLAVLQVPALAAGARHTIEAVIDADVGSVLFGSDIGQLEVNIVAADRDLSNNSQATTAFHMALPTLRLTTALDSTRMAANVAARAVVRVENVSRHAALPASTVGFCVRSVGAPCREGEDAMGVHALALPAIGALQAREVETSFRIPSDAVSQNLVEVYFLDTCIGAGALDARDLTSARAACVEPQLVHVRPDYEACTPPRMEPGQAIAAAPVCVRPCAINAYAVDVEPGFTYLVQTAAGTEDMTLRWRTRYRDNFPDVSAEPGLQPGRAGTAYAVTAPKFCGAPTAGEVVLRRIPL